MYCLFFQFWFLFAKFRGGQMLACPLPAPMFVLWRSDSSSVERTTRRVQERRPSDMLVYAVLTHCHWLSVLAETFLALEWDGGLKGPGIVTRGVQGRWHVGRGTITNSRGEAARRMQHPNEVLMYGAASAAPFSSSYPLLILLLVFLFLVPGRGGRTAVRRRGFHIF
jgi:hypothetical protein